jgi:ATP-binding cassette subfamily B protein
MTGKLMARPEWKFFATLGRASPAIAALWWTVLIVRGLLPAIFAVTMGWLVGAVEQGLPLAFPLTLTGIVFLLLQTLPPLHRAIATNLGSLTAAWLYDDLTRTCTSLPGMGHLEDPRLTSDLSMARDFDLAITAPPLTVSMDFITAGLVELAGGLAAAAVLFGYAWWAPGLLIGAWFATHLLLRESAVWKDRNTDEVRSAQRHADYAYRLAVDAPAAKELRLFGLADWVVERFATNRAHLLDLQWKATRLRERPVVWSLLVVLITNGIVFWSLCSRAAEGSLALAQVVTYASAAAATSMLSFGGFSWALDSSSAPVSAVLRLREAMAPVGTLPNGSQPTGGMPAREVRFKGVSFAYPQGPGNKVLDGFDLTIPAGTSLAIVGKNGAGKTTLAKLLCRLYDPLEGSIEIDGVDLRSMDIDQWRARLAAVFQDFIRFEQTLRQNVAPSGAPDEIVLASLREAGAEGLADLNTVLARGYEGGTDLSGGQWQRVALARAICAVKLGAGLVLLDEPTAQLDIRGEAEIFERVLKATRNATTILISHRFSTVRHADRICVLEHGRVVEIGSHDELMALGGRYRTMFDLQAARFAEGKEEDDAEA